MKIGIINYGVGNLKSVYNSVCRINSNTEIVNNPLSFKQNLIKLFFQEQGLFIIALILLKKITGLKKFKNW